MIRFFAGHQTIANLLMILLLLSGLFIAPTLLRETFPRPDLNEVEVTVPYPGARPEDVEIAICERIENALDAVTGIDTQSCEARENLARALVKMREGEDFQAFTADVKSEIEAISDFPERADPPRIKPLGLTEFVLSVAITGPATRTNLGASSLTTLCGLVSAGFGLTFLPEIAVAREAGASTSLSLRRFGAPEPARQIGILRRRLTRDDGWFGDLADVFRESGEKLIKSANQMFPRQ